MWRKKSQPAVELLLLRFHEAQVPIAAICGATLVDSACRIKSRPSAHQQRTSVLEVYGFRITGTRPSTWMSSRFRTMELLQPVA
jgi:hypothetical protein